MNILYISHSSLATGSESVLITTINNITDSTTNQYVIIPHSKTNNFSCLIDESKVNKQYVLPFKNIGISALKSICCLVYNIYSVLAICWIAKKNAIDLIYVNTSANITGAIAAWILGRRVIWHIHEQPNRNTSIIPPSFRFIYRMMFLNKHFELVFTSRKALKGWEIELRRKIQNYSIINPPSKEIAGYVNHKDDIFTYGYIGTLVESKNLMTLIDCFAKISILNNGNVKLILFGSGPLLCDIKEEVKRLNVSQYVVIKDFNSDVSSFYSSIDVLVQPSYNESWGMVIIEAMSLGIPSIITKESGVAEILNDNKECLMIDPCNKTEIYDKMRLIFENKNLRNMISNNAFLKYKEMALTNTFKKTVYDIIYGK